MPTLLDVKKVLFGAFAVPWVSRAAFVRALAIPFALVAILGVIQTLGAEKMPQPVLWGMIILQALAFVLFAVTCHRLVLLDPLTIAQAPFPRWTWRETRFLLRATVMWFLCMAVGFAFLSLFVFAVAPHIEKLEAPWISAITMPVFLLPMFYLLSRLSLILPAIALDRKVGLGWAWNLSGGNGWRLFVVIGLLPWALSAPATLIAHAAPNVVMTAVATVIGTVLLAVEIAALSLAYRELTREEAV